MIGQPSGVCQHLTCDSIATRAFRDTFATYDVKGKRSEKSELVNLCRDCSELLTMERMKQGIELCLTPEGWIYADNWKWMFWA